MWKFIFGILLIAVMACCPPALADNQDKNIEEMAGKAVETFREKGTDYALKVLNSSAGPFRKGELYVFCVSFDGTTLAHASRRLVQKSVIDLKDAKGKPFIQEFIEVAKSRGAGWTEYWWVRPGEEEPALKKSYIKRIPGEDMFVGVGYYVK